MDPCSAIENGDIVHLRYFECIYGNIVQAILGLAGIVLFAMLLLGGVRYITAGDDPKAAESARKTLTYAIGGLVAIVLSYLVLTLISSLTGQTLIEDFRIAQ